MEELSAISDPLQRNATEGVPYRLKAES